MKHFEIGDRAKIISIETTLQKLGGCRDDMVPLIGEIFTIRNIIGDIHITFEDDPIEYTWHINDIGPVDTSKKVYSGPPPMDKKLFNPLPRHRCPSNGASIYYFLYRHGPRESRFRPSLAEIEKRAKGGMPRTVWENTNRACFAAMTDIVPFRKDVWKNGPPTWCILDLDCHNMEEHELIAWVHLLKQRQVLGPEVDITEWAREGTCRFAIRDHTVPRLYFMLTLLRHLHENQYIVRHTLYLMSLGMNFWVAYVFAHKHGHYSPGNHCFMSGYDIGDYPKDVINWAYKCETYCLFGGETGAYKTPYIKKTARSSFNCNGTIKAIKPKIMCDDLSLSWKDLMKINLLYPTKQLKWRKI